MILPVYFDHLLLADTVTSSLSLEVVLGVPVAVEEDDDVGRHEVDAQTASTRGQEEDELARALLVVLIDGLFTLVTARVTVDAAVLVAPAARGQEGEGEGGSKRKTD